MKDGKITGLAHIGLYVEDAERSREFYENVLGFECIYAYKNGGTVPVVFVQLGTCVIEIVQKNDGIHRGDGLHDHIALNVENIESVAEKLAEKGIVYDEKEITLCEDCFAEGAKWILFRGPDGEHLEITERGPF